MNPEFFGMERAPGFLAVIKNNDCHLFLNVVAADAGCFATVFDVRANLAPVFSSLVHDPDEGKKVTKEFAETLTNSPVDPVWRETRALL